MGKPLLPKEFPCLITERLLLRPLGMEDVTAVFHNFSDPQVAKRFLDEPLESLADAEEMIRELVSLFVSGEGIFWALTLKGSQEMVGTCSFERFSGDHRGEVGFDLGTSWWGQGLMKEALTAVINYGFDVLHLKEVIAITAADNRRALRLLRRLGFRVEGEQKGQARLYLKRRMWVGD